MLFRSRGGLAGTRLCFPSGSVGRRGPLSPRPPCLQPCVGPLPLGGSWDPPPLWMLTRVQCQARLPSSPRPLLVPPSSNPGRGAFCPASDHPPSPHTQVPTTLTPWWVCPPHQSPGPLPAQSSPFHPAPQSTGTSQCLQPHPGGPAGWGLGGGHWTHHLKSPPAPTDLSGVPRRAAPQPIWSLL